MDCCPQCGDRRLAKIDDRLYRCAKCGAYTDGEDDGDVAYGPPDRRLRRQERQRERRHAKR
jgi:DNA-directed RNA polymerase subunit RPC12/RpoP